LHTGGLAESRVGPARGGLEAARDAREEGGRARRIAARARARVPHGRRPRTFARRVRLRAPRGPTGRDPGGRDVPPALAPSLATARAAAGGGSAPAGHDRQGPDSMIRAAVLKIGRAHVW